MKDFAATERASIEELHAQVEALTQELGALDDLDEIRIDLDAHRGLTAGRSRALRAPSERRLRELEQQTQGLEDALVKSLDRFVYRLGAAENAIALATSRSERGVGSPSG